MRLGAGGSEVPEYFGVQPGFLRGQAGCRGRRGESGPVLLVLRPALLPGALCGSNVCLVKCNKV